VSCKGNQRQATRVLYRCIGALAVTELRQHLISRLSTGAQSQHDKELADREASGYYKEAITATSLQHCVGTSLANERGDIEHPPPMDVWPKPCLDTRCICGHKRTWCSYYCHHSDLALETVHEWPCQDDRGYNRGNRQVTEVVFIINI